MSKAASIAFIGAGRMASAMIKGLRLKKVAPQAIACTGGAGKTGRALAKATGIGYQPDLIRLLTTADCVVLTCKPQQFHSLDPIIEQETKGKLVLSILAGLSLELLAKRLSQARNVIRAMPNLPGQIGAGITAFCSLKPLTKNDNAKVHRLLGGLGRLLLVPEEYMDAVTAISGSGPAYVFEFTEALRRAALRIGLPETIAATLAIETVLGAASLMQQTNLTPQKLCQQVASPGGTTEAALKEFCKDDLIGVVDRAVTAAYHRAQELSTT